MVGLFAPCNTHATQINAVVFQTIPPLKMKCMKKLLWIVMFA